VREKILKILKSWRTWAIGVPVIVGFYLLSRVVSVDAVRAYAEKLNSGVAFVLLTILPLAGFPVTPLFIAAGIKFGKGLGMALVASSILLQLLASYGLVHWRRKFFERKFKDAREKIPAGAHGPVTLFTLLLPGVPFFAKNYVIPMLGVPLQTFLLWALPIHIARSVVSVVFGDESNHLTPGRIAALGVYFGATLFASWWAFRRIKEQVGGRPKAAGGRKKPA
jgi:uncharacterized membrane protein YdjX (TVP38/TMEM64 family)